MKQSGRKDYIIFIIKFCYWKTLVIFLDYNKAVSLNQIWRLLQINTVSPHNYVFRQIPIVDTKTIGKLQKKNHKKKEFLFTMIIKTENTKDSNNKDTLYTMFTLRSYYLMQTVFRVTKMSHIQTLSHFIRLLNFVKLFSTNVIQLYFFLTYF